MHLVNLTDKKIDFLFKENNTMNKSLQSILSQKFGSIPFFLTLNFFVL